MLYNILHQLVDIPPHGILGRHLIHPAGMTALISKYQQGLKPIYANSFFPFVIKLFDTKTSGHGNFSDTLGF